MRTHTMCVGLLCACVSGASTNAEPPLAGPALVADLNQAAPGSTIFLMENGPNSLRASFFRQISAGRELWQTTGFAAQTTLRGTFGPSASKLQSAGNVWVGDADKVYLVGPSGPAQLLADFEGTPSQGYRFGFVGDRLYLNGFENATGTEPWVINAGVLSRLADIAPGNAASRTAGWIQSLGGRVVFLASTGNTPNVNIELWTTQGTPQTTQRINGTAGVQGYPAVASQGVTVFVRRGTGIVDELWRTDGTEAGTFAIGPVGWRAQPQRDARLFEEYAPVSLAGTLYFTAQGNLWRTNGTAEGTAIVDLGKLSGSVIDGQLATLGSSYVVCRIAEQDGRVGLYAVRPPSSAAPTRLCDWNAPAVNEWQTPDLPNRLFAVNATATYFANRDAAGVELWRATVDNNGPRAARAGDLHPGPGWSNPQQIVPLGTAQALCVAFAPATGVEPYALIPNAPQPSLVLDLTTGAATGAASSPANAARLGDRVTFNATDGQRPFTWVSDGTRGGTQRLGEATNARPFSTDAWQFLAISTAATGIEPARRDADGVWRTLRDINPGPNGSSVAAVAPIAGRVFFRASNGTTGGEPWVTDGTNAGTIPLGDINPGPASSVAVGFADVGNGEVYFGAFDSDGAAVYATDGTPAGTRRIASLGSPGTDALPVGFTRVGNFVYFAASTPQFGQELWRTDGTQEGTSLVIDAFDGPGGSFPAQLTRVGDRLVFVSVIGDVAQVVAHDPTLPNALILLARYAGTLANEPFTTREGQAHFAGTLPNIASEPFVTTGFPGPGTAPIADINPGASSSFPLNFVNVGVGVAFAAEPDLGNLGRAIYLTDGTIAGTRRLDATNGEPLRGVSDIVRVNNRVFFAARDPIAGIEPHVLDVCPADLNNDGSADMDDFMGFWAAFDLETPPADRTRDGVLDLRDFFLFFDSFDAGCP